MKQPSIFFKSLVVPAVFVISLGGCGGPDNTVIQPGALTPEQQAEMDQLGDQMRESMSRSPGASGEPSKIGN